MTNEQIAMRRSGLITAVIGGLFSLMVIPQLHIFAWAFLQLAYWPMAEVPRELVTPVGLAIAISGGLTVGIGAMLWSVATYVMPVAAEAGRKVVRTSAWSWFAVDSTFSVVAGAPFNVLLNLGFLLLLLGCLRRETAPQTDQLA